MHIDKRKIDTKVTKILEQFHSSDFEISIVGGGVRDLLLGKDVTDWDLTTNATPKEILKLYPKAYYNNSFGTVGLVIGKDADGKPNEIQITTYRVEEKYSDRRHPDKISWGKTLEEDLGRRDFTVNALALKYGDDNELNLIDLYKGQEDLKKKIIKTVREPDERFGEDALRLLRAVRFATTLGFTIESRTKASIIKNANLLEKISGERIRDELFKIIDSENAAAGILFCRETGLLNKILQELEACFSVEQKSPKRHHVYDVGTHCVKSLETCPSGDTIVRLATLLHDIGKAKVAKVTNEGVRTFYNHEVVGGRQVREIAARLHLRKEDREKLFKLVRFHQFSVNENQTDKALRRFIKNVGVESIEDMMDLRIGDRLGGGLQQPESWRLKLFRKRLKEVLKKPFTVADLNISGHDVMKALGVNQGKKIGEVLNKLFEEVANDKQKNTRQYLLKRLINLS